MILIEKQKIKLDKKYVILDSLFFILFVGALLFGQIKLIKFSIANIFLFVRVGIRLKNYCDCQEGNEENDLEIFFKVILLIDSVGEDDRDDVVFYLVCDFYSEIR